MAIYYVNFLNGNNANSGTSFANAVLDLNANALTGATGGDEIRCIESPAPFLATDINGNSFTGNWKEMVDCVTSSSTSIVANINTCSGGWISSTNVFSSTNTSVMKEGDRSTTISLQSGLTGGKLAFATCGTPILSAFTGISFWIRTGNVNSFSAINRFYFALCSDASGDNIAHSFYINTQLKQDVFLPFSISSGLSSITGTISSIALYSVTGAASFLGTATLYIDNIIAVKDINLSSYLSTTSNEDLFYMPQSITYSATGTKIYFDVPIGSDYSIGYRGVYFNKNKHYNGITSSTSDLYVANPIKLSASSQSISTSGISDALPVKYTFGWDSIAMTSQTGQTLLTSLTGISTSDWILKPVSGRGVKFNLFERLKTYGYSVLITGNANNQYNFILSASEICSGNVKLNSNGNQKNLTGNSIYDCYIYNFVNYGIYINGYISRFNAERNTIFTKGNDASFTELILDNATESTRNTFISIKNSLLLGGSSFIFCSALTNSIIDSITCGYHYSYIINMNGVSIISNNTISNISLLNNINNTQGTFIAINTRIVNCTFKNISMSVTGTQPFPITLSNNNKFYNISLTALNNQSARFITFVNSNNNEFYGVSAHNFSRIIENSSNSLMNNNKFYNLHVSTTSNNLPSIYYSGGVNTNYGDTYIKSLTYSPATANINSYAFSALQSTSGKAGKLSIDYINNTKQNKVFSKVLTDRTTSQSVTGFTYSGTGYSIEITPIFTDAHGFYNIWYDELVPYEIYSNPFVIKSDGNPITLSLKAYRTSSAITAGIAFEPFQTISGMTNSLSTTLSSITAWQDLSLTFTPTSTFEGRLKFFSWSTISSATAYFDGQVTYS